MVDLAASEALAVTVLMIVCFSVIVEMPVVRMGTDRTVVRATVVLATVIVEYWTIVLVATLNVEIGVKVPAWTGGRLVLVPTDKTINQWMPIAVRVLS